MFFLQACHAQCAQHLETLAGAYHIEVILLRHFGEHLRSSNSVQSSIWPGLCLCLGVGVRTGSGSQSDIVSPMDRGYL